MIIMVGKEKLFNVKQLAIKQTQESYIAIIYQIHLQLFRKQSGNIKNL